MQRKPNVILINCDDLGYGDLGCYGSQAHKTPALDLMAQNGIQFTDFYMASPVCSPSRGAMMTGCYPKRIGFDQFEGRHVLFPGQGVGLNPDEITIAKALKGADYATMMIGKWHCGDQKEFLPTRHGFDHYYGLPYSNDMGRQTGSRHMLPPLPLMDDEQVLQAQPDQASLTERYLEQAVKFIRNHQEEPFFLYFAHMYVHLPLYVPKRFLEQSENGPYGAAVACIDWTTGVLMEELKLLGLEQDTLVIFTSDNGSRCDYGASNGRLRGTKNTTWEGGMRLPCLMSWPGTIPAGGICGEIATSMDFLPTLCALAGASLPNDRVIDGKDILPLMLQEEDAASPHEAFFYYHSSKLAAVRCGEWKLHVHRKDETVWELYHLKEDVSESRNVAEEHPEVVARLELLLEACRADLGDAAADRMGANCREIGRAANPEPLTQYKEHYPYYMAMYDLGDRG
ncbi:sulfatase [Paenibacillus sp. HB172176]|uniref:sulfatase family protein n=1 Tax=Paenibacillus sp. HB172176 TaxID=2493690 RepID=UPI00143A3E00|nr:sulfatase [Paenibacillus sp. HB172176]